MTQARQAAAFNAKTSRRVLVAQMTLSAALLFSGMATANNCRAITGTVSPLVQITCAVLGYLPCFQGTFSGDLSGSFQSRLLSMTPVPYAPGMLSFTASTVIQISAPDGTLGTLYTSDVGIGSGSYATEILTITSGDGAYKMAYGSIVLSGGYLAGSPGVYQGQLCADKDRDDKSQK